MRTCTCSALGSRGAGPIVSTSRLIVASSRRSGGSKTPGVSGPPLRSPAGARYRIEELAGVVGLGGAEGGCGWAGLRGRAAVHDDALVADLAHHAKVVRDEHVGEPKRAAQAGKQVQDLRLDTDVERRDCLVEDQHAWPGRECPGYGDPLSFAPGKGAGPAVAVTVVEPALS